MLLSDLLLEADLLERGINVVVHADEAEVSLLFLEVINCFDELACGGYVREYNTSEGEHGTGAKAVNALSTKLIVTSSNNSLTEIVEFSKGKFINYSQKECPKDKTGLTVQFYPDSEVLEDLDEIISS